MAELLYAHVRMSTDSRVLAWPRRSRARRLLHRQQINRVCTRISSARWTATTNLSRIRLTLRVENGNETSHLPPHPCDPLLPPHPKHNQQQQQRQQQNDPQTEKQQPQDRQRERKRERKKRQMHENSPGSMHQCARCEQLGIGNKLVKGDARLPGFRTQARPPMLTAGACNQPILSAALAPVHHVLVGVAPSLPKAPPDLKTGPWPTPDHGTAPEPAPGPGCFAEVTGDACCRSCNVPADRECVPATGAGDISQSAQLTSSNSCIATLPFCVNWELQLCSSWVFCTVNNDVVS